AQPAHTARRIPIRPVGPVGPVGPVSTLERGEHSEEQQGTERANGAHHDGLLNRVDGCRRPTLRLWVAGTNRRAVERSSQSPAMLPQPVDDYTAGERRQVHVSVGYRRS